AHQLVTECHELKLPAADGKSYRTDCANIETMFRIIQSIPSKKAEPFKQRLAKVGFERIRETAEPSRMACRHPKGHRWRLAAAGWTGCRRRRCPTAQNGQASDTWQMPS